MLIACPACATSYEIDLSALGSSGRTVRCAQCKETWFATPAEALATTAVATLERALPDEPPHAGPHPDGHFTVPFARDITPVRDDSVSIINAPAIAPEEPFPAEAPKFEPGVPDSGETIAESRPRQSARKGKRGALRRLVSLPMAIVALLAVIGAILNWRVNIVRQLPQTASLFAAIGLPVNLRGLVFQDVKSTTEVQDGMTVLVVEGTIVNLTTRTQDVPRLRLALRNAAGHEVYAWTAVAPRPTVSSGAGVVFRTRLASPPPDGRDVIVRFFNRRDITAGLQ